MLLSVRLGELSRDLLFELLKVVGTQKITHITQHVRALVSSLRDFVIRSPHMCCLEDLVEASLDTVLVEECLQQVDCSLVSRLGMLVV